MSDDYVPAWTKDSVFLRIGDLTKVDTLSPEWALDGATGRGVRVAVIDSGIDADHPQLDACVDRAGAVDFSVDAEGKVVKVEGPHADVYGHGTACAGIIHTLAPEATITSVRVLGPGLQGKAASFHAGLQWAVENEFDVINLSLGASKRDWALAFHDVCDLAYFNNSFIVTAANNIRRTSFPSLYSAVASVACNTSDDPLRFHYNPEPPTEFLARGIDVEVPWLDGGTTVTTGNSFAAPHIAAFAALIRSKHPGLQPFLVKAALWACSANIRFPQAPVDAAGGVHGTATTPRARATLTSHAAQGLVEEAAVLEETPGREVPSTSPNQGTGLTADRPRAEPRRVGADMAAAQELLSEITLTGLLARGSWGTVFSGVGPAGDVAVRAVDRALVADRALVRRFISSVRASTQLVSNHVIPVLDVVERDGDILIVMPRCPSTLAAQPTPMAVGDVCVAGLSLLAGLEAAHKVGVLHGDLNANNALIDTSNRVVVSDVGLAAPLQTTEKTSRFHPDEWVSLAPEQILGHAIGTFTDTYAVATVLYELLSGRPPFSPTKNFGVLRARTSAKPAAAPLAKVSSTPEGVARVIGRALDHEPSNRYAAAGDMFEALAGAAFEGLGTGFIDQSRFRLQV